MNFAIRFYRECRVLSKADEIIIKYNEKNSNLLDFIQKHEDTKRIIVDITNLTDSIESCLDIFKAAYEIHPQFAVLLSYTQDYTLIREAEIPFFFVEGANSYDDVSSQIEEGVSDIYIIDELGFNIVKISDFCHKNNVKVRAFPNICQTSSMTYKDTFRQFFIRPEAVSIYEPYIDVFEFVGPIDKQPVFYDIYKREEWIGDLDNIIVGLNEKINNATIAPYFDSMRLDCNKRCSLSKCDICEAVNKLGDTLKQKGLRIIKEKKRKNEYKTNEESL